MFSYKFQFIYYLLWKISNFHYYLNNKIIWNSLFVSRGDGIMGQITDSKKFGEMKIYYKKVEIINLTEKVGHKYENI